MTAPADRPAATRPTIGGQVVIHFDGDSPSAVLRDAAAYIEDRPSSRLDDTDIAGMRYSADYDHTSPCRLTLVLDERIRRQETP